MEHKDASAYLPQLREDEVLPEDALPLFLRQQTLGETFLTKSEASATYVGLEDRALDLRKQDGVVGDGVADDAAAITAAAASAATFGLRLFARGRFRINSTVTLHADLDLSDATFEFYGTGVAVQVGNGTDVLNRRVLDLPRVVDALKPETGWRSGTVGVRLAAAYGCIVQVPHVKNFETGLQIYGSGGNGVSYCTVTVGGLDNNKVNQELTADATGWANQNLFLGGRYSHNSTEGTQVVGVRHIYLADVPTSRPNGNTWVGASLESPNVVQYALDVESGQYNVFQNCRWENSAAAPRIRWGAKAQQNMIEGGFGADDLTVTIVAGAIRNRVTTTDRMELQGAGNPILRLENVGSSAQGVLGIYNAGTMSAAYNPADWSILLAATGLRAKSKADSSDRFALDIAGRKLTLGAGINTSARAIHWGAGSPEGVTTTDTGSIFINYGTGFGAFLKASGSGNTGWQAIGAQPFTTTERPTAASAGVGGSYFDTTLNKPLWSDGTNWRDATGAIA